MVEVYSDGCCWPNDGKGNGTYAFVVIKDNQILHEHVSHRKPTTNNRMELSGVASALKYLLEFHPDEEAIIYCDSKYVVQGYNEWIFNWIKKNKQNVSNADIWSYLHQLRSDKIKLEWIKGHNDHQWNEHADKLCTKEYKRVFGKAPAIEARHKKG